MNSDKTYCLITGASNGIGKALAEECTKRNMNLFLVALPESGLEELANHLSQVNDNDIKCLSIDLTLPDAPKKVFDYAKTNRLTVNKLINNAGVGGENNMMDQNPDDIDTMIQLNIRATTLLTYYFLKEMKGLPKAYILNVSSFGAFLPLPKKCVYAATKTYILFFSRSLHAELKGTNITVSSVYPSGVTTNSRVKETIQKSHFMARITTLQPSDVARVSVKGMLKGRRIITPGFATTLFYILGSLLPYGIVFRMVGRIFKKSS
ncbi:MAG: SDR family NAD(P)-dependent oxidoreductase [Prolixibacteraceae bacterium]|nr:SDR family NAD(P)-dependent oxidoreductase [Prolixibacteraceae bacterium]